MKKYWFISLVSILCVASIILNLVLFHNYHRARTQIENAGFGVALTDLKEAQMQLKSNKIRSASNDINRASGALLTINYPLGDFGYQHLADISIHVGIIGVDAQQGNLSATDKQYLKSITNILNSMFHNGSVVESKIAPGLNKMYRDIG